MTIWIVILMAFLGGFVQGVTGFGGGIVMMMVFPMLFPLTQAAGINGAILVFLNSTMVYVYRKYINIKMVLPVFLFSIIVSTITIKVAAGAAPLMIKKMFGGFLLLLAIYYLFIKKDGRPDPMNLFVSLLFLTVSAVCDGLFGICGPMLVIYFLARCEERYDYLANLTTSFLLLGGYNTCFRIYSGILTGEHILYILCGAAAIVAGGLIAKKIADRLNAQLLTKAIYIMIFVSGISNILK